MPGSINKDDSRAKFVQLGWKSLFLLLVLAVYLAIGSVVFHVLEHKARIGEVEEAVEELEEDRAQLLKVLWAAALAKSEDDWTLFANERMDLYESEMVQHVHQGDFDVQNPGESRNPWSIEGAFFYCFTIVTTIGYGNIAPVTASGKVATVIYGLIGIPLTLYLLSVIGRFLTIALKLSINTIGSTPSPNDSSSIDTFDFGLLMIGALFAAFLGFGAALFGYVEEWDWLDAGYFSFVTFSTIGFGDMVPRNTYAALLASGFIFSGLSLLSLIFTVLQQKAEIHLDKLYVYFTTRSNDIGMIRAKNGGSGSSMNTDSTKSGSTTKITPQYQSPSAYQQKNSWNNKPSAVQEEEVEEAEVEEDQT